LSHVKTKLIFKLYIMAEKGEVVILKSGGPEMIVSYVLKAGDGSREKAARMKGFKKGDIVCEYQQQLPNGQMKLITNTFKAVCLKYKDGKAVAEAGADNKEEDDDDW
jgi:uncharacterized protein YodC (DUF2158 family)